MVFCEFAAGPVQSSHHHAYLYHCESVLAISDERFRTDRGLYNFWLPTEMYNGEVKETIHDLGKELVKQWTSRDCFIVPEPWGELIIAYPLDPATNPQKPTLLLTS